MKIFSKKNTVAPDGQRASRIAEHIIVRQQKLANYLNARTSKVSQRRLMLWLIGCSLVFGSYFLNLVLGIF